MKKARFQVLKKKNSGLFLENIYKLVNAGFQTPAEYHAEVLKFISNLKDTGYWKMAEEITKIKDKYAAVSCDIPSCKEPKYNNNSKCEQHQYLDDMIERGIKC